MVHTRIIPACPGKTTKAAVSGAVKDDASTFTSVLEKRLDMGKVVLVMLGYTLDKSHWCWPASISLCILLNVVSMWSCTSERHEIRLESAVRVVYIQTSWEMRLEFEMVLTEILWEPGRWRIISFLDCQWQIYIPGRIIIRSQILFEKQKCRKNLKHFDGYIFIVLFTYY